MKQFFLCSEKDTLWFVYCTNTTEYMLKCLKKQNFIQILNEFSLYVVQTALKEHSFPL